MEARIIGLKGAGKRTLLAALSDGPCRQEGPMGPSPLSGWAAMPACAASLRSSGPRRPPSPSSRSAWPPADSHLQASRSEMERYLISWLTLRVFLHVLRGFDNSGAGGDSCNPSRDLAALDQEFPMGDLIAIERF